MCHAGTVDDVTWGALTLTLTAIGGFYTWWAYKNRGMTPAIRGLAHHPAARGGVADGHAADVHRDRRRGHRLGRPPAFSPKVWLGVILAALSVGLFFLSGLLRDRGIGGGTPAPYVVGHPEERRAAAGAPRRRSSRPGPLADDGIDDEIAEILKRRGIS